MGLWHIFKQLQLEIWKYGARLFFAPLFHRMFPGQKFNIRPKHMFLTWILSLVRVAYGQFKDGIEDLMINVALDDKTYRYVENVRILCEYFIPVVNFSHYPNNLCRHMITRFGSGNIMESMSSSCCIMFCVFSEFASPVCIRKLLLSF